MSDLNFSKYFAAAFEDKRLPYDYQGRRGYLETLLLAADARTSRNQTTH